MPDVTATTHKSRKPPKIIEHIRLSPGTNGGVTVHHHFTHYEHPPEGPHIFAADEGKKLASHLSKHLSMASLGGESEQE